MTGQRVALSVEQILEWAEAHKVRTGMWPSRNAGPVPEAPGETWGGIETALRAGRGGLPGGDTLAQLLRRHKRMGLMGL